MMELENDARFANILDECCGRVRRGEELERCLADYPAEYWDELQRLVPMAARVSLLTRDPSSDFKAKLEEELRASVDTARTAERPSILVRMGRFFSSPSLSRAVVTAAAVVVVLAGSGIGVDRASAGSLPDSPLYQVKAVKEQVQLALARGAESQVDVHAAQLGERGRELDQAVQGDKQSKVVEAVVTRVETSVERMVDQALVARGRGNPTPSRRAFVASRAALRRLDSIIPKARPNVRPALRELRDFLAREEQRLLRGAAGAPSGRAVQLRQSN